MVTFQKLRLKALSEETYDLLKSKILSGELPLEERIDVALVSKQLGVSRTPVNDALRKLSNQGLVQIHPRRGTFVTRVTPENVEDVYHLRQALEGKAAELAAQHFDASKVTVLRKLNAGLSKKGLVMSDHLKINQEFHRFIVQSCGNKLLVKAFLELEAHMRILQVYFGSSDWQKYSPGIVRGHSLIIEALASNHPQDARKSVEDHIQASMMRLLSAVQAPEIVSPRKLRKSTGPSEKEMAGDIVLATPEEPHIVATTSKGSNG